MKKRNGFQICVDLDLGYQKSDQMRLLIGKKRNKKNKVKWVSHLPETKISHFVSNGRSLCSLRLY